MTAPRHDRGLHAVARVRAVREHDARIGLQLALTELHARRETASTLVTRLGEADARVGGRPGDVLSMRLGLTHLGEAIRAAEAEAMTQQLVVDEARNRWQLAATELKAVEQLLTRRSARRRTAAARAEAKELDDLAAVRFARAEPMGASS